MEKQKRNMEVEDIFEVIVEESDSIVYLAELDTHELIYMNKVARDILGLMNPDEYKGRKCFKLLQGKDEPCEFCTNAMLNDRQFYTWEHYNKSLKDYFIIRDRLIPYRDHFVRLEIATDITKKEKENKKLREKLSLEHTLVKCVQTLSLGDDFDLSLNNLLEIIGEYYCGERAYIFEFNFKKLEIRNTYEWCRQGVNSEKKNLQHIPINYIDRWMKQFREVGEFYIASLDRNADRNSPEYQILNDQGIESLVAAPLISNGEIVGFLGVDNPGSNTDELSLLKSVSYFVINDIGKRKMMRQLEQLSYSDSLTGLLNRNKYNEVLRELSQNPPNMTGVIYIDINGLKRANDTYGHSYGDGLIRRAADIISELFDSNVYRIGGDEFVVLCIDMSKEEFGQVVGVLRKKIEEDELVSASIGSSWNMREENVENLVTDADDLMYVEKQSYYKDVMVANGTQRLGIAQELIQAVRDDRFVVYLQPKVEIKTGRLIGAEALVRQKDSRERIIPPDKFIPLYEREGIIRHIDFFVLETVCKTIRKWMDSKIQPVKVYTNLSRITLMEHDIVDSLLGVCRAHKVKPQQIGLEVTESVSKMDHEKLAGLVEALSEAGFSISLDDFGSQYSNLAILASISFDELKLDRSLIMNLREEQSSNNVIVAHSIAMGRDLNNTPTVAEGVENMDQLGILENYNCEYGQGYYFSRPIPIDEFTEKFMKV